jgi:hypothetical protein
MTTKSMYYLDMNSKLRSLKGEESEVVIGELVGDAIAGCGAEQCKGLKPAKLVGWAMKLAAKEPLPLDETDFDALREFVGLLPRLNLLVLAQADACFKAAKEKKAE